MKITHKSGNQPLIAVIDSTNNGFYLREENSDCSSFYIDKSGFVSEVSKTLEQLLASNSRLTPVYQGEKFVVDFGESSTGPVFRGETFITNL